MQKSYHTNRLRIADINTRTEENLSGIRVVKSFVGEEVEIKKFEAENNKFYSSRTSIYKDEALHFTVMEKFFGQGITLAIVVFGGTLIAREYLSLSNLLIFIMYAAYLTAPIPKLAFMVQQYQDGISGYRRFREIVDIGIQEYKNNPDLSIDNGRVEFKNVSFRYNDDLEYVLKNINLDVSAGETVAIIGSSGIGKTTLCSLIPRYYEVSSGDILIDGKSIYDVNLQSLRSQIGVVRQETFLFAGTIMENILYGKPNASEADAIEAAKLANAHEFITSLPDGYYTDIGQRGVKLSGGQQQRISIARVFLKNPPILILDEATSALDYESEMSVLESLKALTKNRTTLIITHRMTLVEHANRVIKLDNKSIIQV